MRKIGNDNEISRNYGQLLFENDTLLPSENAEIEEMKKQYLAKQRVIKVKTALIPWSTIRPRL